MEIKSKPLANLLTCRASFDSEQFKLYFILFCGTFPLRKTEKIVVMVSFSFLNTGADSQVREVGSKHAA